MNFIVTVMCAVHLKSCPLPAPIVNEFQAKSRAECVTKVREMIAHYQFKKGDFDISCKPKE